MDSRKSLQTTARAPAAGAAGAAVQLQWQVRLLGALEARCGGHVITHFPTRAAAALLARLALQPERAHAREEMVELLWPGAPPEARRNRLRQALSALKSLLSAAGGADPISADRISIRAQAGALTSDAGQFDRLVRAGDAPAARALHGGEFMPGHYEDGVIKERQRLRELFQRLDQALVAAALQSTPPAAASSAAPPAVDAARASNLSPLPPDVAPLPSGLPHYWTRSIGAEMAASRLTACEVFRHARSCAHSGAARRCKCSPQPGLRLCIAPRSTPF